jgi:hypothetical protein
MTASQINPWERDVQSKPERGFAASYVKAIREAEAKRKSKRKYCGKIEGTVDRTFTDPIKLRDVRGLGTKRRRRSGY